jgi:hypothetical protein
MSSEAADEGPQKATAAYIVNFCVRRPMQPRRSARVLASSLRLPTTLLLALIIAVAGTGGLAWWQWREIVVLRATAAEAQDRSALEARLAELKKRNFELQATLTALRAAPPGTSDAGAGETPKPKLKAESDETVMLAKLAALAVNNGDTASKRDDDLELLAAMSELPEFQKLLALEQRGKVDEKYADLFRKLKLSPEELARVQTLLADRESAFSDALMAARAQGLTGKEARQVANEVARATQKDINGTLKDVLGPQRFGQLQNYERTAPQRETVEQLATRLSYTGAPLTPRQQDQLVQTLASNGAPRTDQNGAPIVNKKGVVQKQPPGTVAPLPGTVAGLGLGASNGTTVISTGAIAAAQSFLSPQQLAALQRMQQEQQAQQTIGNLLRTGTVNAPVKNKPKPKG